MNKAPSVERSVVVNIDNTIPDFDMSTSDDHEVYLTDYSHAKPSSRSETPIINEELREGLEHWLARS